MFLKKNSIPLVAAFLLVAAYPGTTHAQDGKREYMYIVGSSTVYPFAKAVADKLATSSLAQPPKIRSTGSGLGFQLFCAGTGPEHPDITNASRRIKKSEFDQCRSNGVMNIVEVKIGYDGIVVAQSKNSPPLQLTRNDIFRALARTIPSPDDEEKLIPNPCKTWKDVNPALPDRKIEVYGPPTTSGTRDAFAELAMESGCESFAVIIGMKKKDKKKYKEICCTLREDGAYIEAGENDNLIVQRLEANPDAVGIFGFSFLDQNSDKIQGALVEGINPSYGSIESETYPLSRSLFFYVKKNRIGTIPGIEEYLTEFTSENAWGPGGYLVSGGLVSLPGEEREKSRSLSRSLTELEMR